METRFVFNALDPGDVLRRLEEIERALGTINLDKERPMLVNVKTETIGMLMAAGPEFYPWIDRGDEPAQEDEELLNCLYELQRFIWRRFDTEWLPTQSAREWNHHEKVQRDAHALGCMLQNMRENRRPDKLESEAYCAGRLVLSSVSKNDVPHFNDLIEKAIRRIQDHAKGKVVPLHAIDG